MKLVFINEIGQDFKGQYVYEFLFSDSNEDDVSGDFWDSRPASGNPESPIEYVNMAYRLNSDFELGLIQDHETFNMLDAKHKIIPLGWEEDFDFEESIYDKRLFFRFGETIQEVEEKLYARDKIINKFYEKEN